MLCANFVCTVHNHELGSSSVRAYQYALLQIVSQEYGQFVGFYPRVRSAIACRLLVVVCRCVGLSVLLSICWSGFIWRDAVSRSSEILNISRPRDEDTSDHELLCSKYSCIYSHSQKPTIAFLLLMTTVSLLSVQGKSVPHRCVY